MNEDQKDEYKIDPMNSVLEFLGSMRKGENVWIQILIRRHEKEGLKHGRFVEKKDWTEDIDKEIKKINAEREKVRNVTKNIKESIK